MKSISFFFDSLEEAIAALDDLEEFVPRTDVSLLTPARTDDLCPVTGDLRKVGGPMGAFLAGGLGLGRVSAVILPGVGTIAGTGSVMAMMGSEGLIGRRGRDGHDWTSEDGIAPSDVASFEAALRNGWTCLIARVREPVQEESVRAALVAKGATINEPGLSP
jgi:hypothetical protein